MNLGNIHTTINKLEDFHIVRAIISIKNNFFDRYGIGSAPIAT
ncbi:MAG TPA: hypothetical protein VLA74_10295 [Nitrososphaeraceae archaeon]|nr:hypothetical protein [Nitrososphaeraceae archaeon]